MKFKRVYIDGPDLTGKTTLIANLNKITDYQYYIGDRSPMSCYVYNKLYNRNAEINKEILNYLNSCTETIIVLIHDDFDLLKERYNKRGDELQTVESIKIINKLYTETLSEINNPNIIFLTVSQVMELSIINWLKLLN